MRARKSPPVGSGGRAKEERTLACSVHDTSSSFLEAPSRTVALMKLGGSAEDMLVWFFLFPAGSGNHHPSLSIGRILFNQSFCRRMCPSGFRQNAEQMRGNGGRHLSGFTFTSYILCWYVRGSIPSSLFPFSPTSTLSKFV